MATDTALQLVNAAASSTGAIVTSSIPIFYVVLGVAVAVVALILVFSMWRVILAAFKRII